MNFSYFNIKIIKTKNDAKNQYRKLTLRYHPDTYGTDEAMKIVNNEYNFLINNFDTVVNSSNKKSYNNYSKNIEIVNNDNDKQQKTQSYINNLDQYIIDNDIYIPLISPFWTRGDNEWKKYIVELFMKTGQYTNKDYEEAKKFDQFLKELKLREKENNNTNKKKKKKENFWEWELRKEKENKRTDIIMTLIVIIVILTLMILSSYLITIYM